MTRSRRAFAAVIVAAAGLTACSRSPQRHFDKGTAYFKEQKYAKAAAHFEKAIAAAPATAQSLTFLGVCRLHQGKRDAAIRNFQDALQLDSNYVPARYNLALAQLESGQAESAANALRQLAQTPGVPADATVHLATAYNNLAVGAAHQRDIKRAEHYFQLAVAADPKSVAAKNLAALKLPALPPQKPEPAKPAPPAPTPPAKPPEPAKPVAPEPVVSVPPQPKPVAVTPAPAPPKPVVTPAPTPSPQPVTRPKRAPIAVKSLKAGNRAKATPFFNEGAKQFERRNLSAAVTAYTKAIAADPAFAVAYYNLAIAYREAGQPSKALDNYELALVADPKYADARFNYAVLLSEQGFADDAIAQFERILSFNPNDAAAHLSVAGLYARERTGQDKARAHYEAFLRLSPNSPLARDVRRWLDQNR